MGTFTTLNTDQINHILDFYKLGTAMEIVPTTEGTSNTNYQVILENNERVLLKVCNDKTLEQLQNEQTILEVLDKYKYKYSLAPYRTEAGKSIYQYDNYFGVVFPFVDARPPERNEKTCKQIGMALAELHSLQIQKEDLDLIRAHDLVGHGGIGLYEYVNSAHAQEDFRDAFNKIFPRQLIDLPYDLFPAGIIHGDLYYDNSLFKNKKLVTLIDFEQAGRGRYLLDIGISISGSCLTEDGSNIDPSLLTSFMKGYRKKRKLINIEEDFLNEAILVGLFSPSPFGVFSAS
jgi:homoserine kinase type II